MINARDIASRNCLELLPFQIIRQQIVQKLKRLALLAHFLKREMKRLFFRMRKILLPFFHIRYYVKAINLALQIKYSFTRY